MSPRQQRPCRVVRTERRKLHTQQRGYACSLSNPLSTFWLVYTIALFSLFRCSRTSEHRTHLSPHLSVRYVKAPVELQKCLSVPHLVLCRSRLLQSIWERTGEPAVATLPPIFCEARERDAKFRSDCLTAASSTGASVTVCICRCWDRRWGESNDNHYVNRAYCFSRIS
jgi:hypothetical protein